MYMFRLRRCKCLGYPTELLMLKLKSQKALKSETPVSLAALRPFKNDITEFGGGEYPKLVTKSDIGRRVVHANSDFNTKKKLGISFYLSLIFGQHSNS